MDVIQLCGASILGAMSASPEDPPAEDRTSWRKPRRGSWSALPTPMRAEHSPRQRRIVPPELDQPRSKQTAPLAGDQV
jgi:hypothetical protein